jgi:hypothetical protein
MLARIGLVTGVLGLAVSATLALLLAAALSNKPAVGSPSAPVPEDVARAVELARTHDPRRAAPGAVNAVMLGERDLDVLLNHAAHRWLNASVRVALQRGEATVEASLPLPDNPFGGWLNLRATLVEAQELPRLASLRVGWLPLPAGLSEWLLDCALRNRGLQADWAALAPVLRQVQFHPQQLRVVYALKGDSLQRLAGALLSPEDQQRLRAYGERLAQLAANPHRASGRPTSLAPFIGPLFELARQRSSGGDAAAENRAALVMLTLYANGRGLEMLMPGARDLPQPRPLRLTLGGRDDFPLHLLISATLAAEGTGPLSRAVGVFKEVADSRGGSGFSFNDMAANRAGTRLGELAVSQPERLQTLLALGVQEADIMPAWADLPEFMAEPEFLRRFGGVGGPAYQAMMAEIDRRVGLLPVLR